MPGAAPHGVVIGALWILTALFLLRVGGQLWVSTTPRRLHGFLPPMERWYSGLLAYRWLLPAQILILAFQVTANRQVAERSGWLGAADPGAGACWLAFAALYAAAMTWRLVRWLRSPPERRGVLIPIVFHFVLAAYAATLAAWHLSV